MPEELPEQFKNAEYRLRTIISNHSGIDSIGLEMNIHIKGNKTYFANVQTSVHFWKD